MRTRGTASLAAVALCLALLPASSATSAPPAPVAADPVLKLFNTKSEATAYRYGRRAARLDNVLFIGVTGGPLDLRVRRSSFADPVTLTQKLHTSSGTVERRLPADLLDGWRGLDNFFHVRVADVAGAPVWSELVSFCPNNYSRQRLDDSGPDVPTFPENCFRSPRLLGMAWGIDQSWAVAASNSGLRLPIREGSYSLDVSIAPRYRELFDIAAEDASAQIALTVRNLEGGGCERCCFDCPRHAYEANRTMQAAGSVPDMTNPDDSVLPDLRTLPAFGIHVRNRKNGRSFVEFGANVWVAGDAPIVVEGFRRGEEAVMDAYQYFYDDGEAVGRAPAGSFIYDLRDAHHHWHILQFVQYELVDADQQNAIKSAKESFCLVPTDAVDLSMDAAARTAERQSLHTSCGGEEALWIRETLPVGWGDTYYQGGRYGFNITDVPNGTYFVEVTANPDGLLYEQDETNNVSLREIVLRGKRGDRNVTVEDPYGIDGRGRF